MKYCIYLRKSRSDMEAEAHGEGETLARHERILLDLAKRRNYNVTQIYREIVSGETISDRPVMKKLLQEVENGFWTGVLVMEVERLARGDTIDQGIMAQTFKYSGTKIITPLKVYNPENEFDEEYFEFGLFMSRREYKTINRRLQRGRDEAAKEGRYIGSLAPYGYEKIRIPHDKGFTLKPVEEKADVVRLIFQLFVYGEQCENGQLRQLGARSIATKLNSMGIVSPTEQEYWAVSSVKMILSNPVYVGKIRYKYRKSNKQIVDGVVQTRMKLANSDEMILVDGLHPALISDNTFEKAQELMKNKALPSVPNKNQLLNPLAGILICGMCGRVMGRKSSPPPDKIRCLYRGCKNVGSYLSIVEERILQALSDWLSEYQLDYSDVSVNEEDNLIDLKQSAINKNRNEINKLYKQLSRTHDLLEQGVYDTELFLKRSRSITERIEAAEECLKKLSVELLEDKQRASNRRNVIPKVKNLLEVYRDLPCAKAKNDLLKDVLDKVVYTKEHRAHKGQPLDDFELTIFPKLDEK